MTSPSPAFHVDMPLWKLELIQRKKKLMHTNGNMPSKAQNADIHSMDTMESEANERASSNSGNSVGTTEQLHSRHGHEHIAVSATNSHHHQFGISSAESFLNSELVASLSSDLTTPTSIHSTEKSTPSNNLYDNSINNKKSLIEATNNSLTATTKQVLKKYFVENSCDSSVPASSKNHNLNNTSRKLNSSDGSASTSVFANWIGSVGDSGSENSNQVNNWFPSKRNSLINLLDNSNNSSELPDGCSTPARRLEKRCKMVAMQDLSTGSSETANNSYSFDDPSEELQYGPGIVSKLRCRYLSLALRQSVAKQRPSLDNLRRSTSLNNLIDEDENDIDVDEVDDHSGHGADAVAKSTTILIIDQNGLNNDDAGRQPKNMANGSKSQLFETDRNDTRRIGDHYAAQKPPIRPTLFGGSGGGGGIVKYVGEIRCRQTQRGNDSLKRARSVEALMRYDTLAWRRDQLNDSEEYPSSNPIILDELIVSESTMAKTKTAQEITIEDKIQQARDRIVVKTPKRLTSFMDETERPPPDLVKQTLLKFEATANRRPRGVLQRYGNGDVAAKVATFKMKISQDKAMPAVVYPKPTTAPLPLQTTPTSSSPLSPSKPIVKPRMNSPKPIVLNRCAITTNGNIKQTGVNVAKPHLTTFRQNNKHHANVGEISPEYTDDSKFWRNTAKSHSQLHGMPMSKTGHAIRFDATSYRKAKSETLLVSPETSPQSSRLSSRLSPTNTRESPRMNNAFDKKPFNEQNICDSPSMNVLTRRDSPCSTEFRPNSHADVNSGEILPQPTAACEFGRNVARHGDTRRLSPSANDEATGSCDSDADSTDDEDGQNSSSNGYTGSYDVNVSDNCDSDNSVAASSDVLVLNKKYVPSSELESLSKARTSVSKSIALNGDANSSCMQQVNAAVQHLADQTVPPEPSVRQIGIIRPLIAEPKLLPPPPPPPVASARSLLSPATIKVSMISSPIVITNSVTNTTDSDVLMFECGTNSRTIFGSSSPSLRPALAQNLPTGRDSSSASMVHQKNLLNKEKNTVTVLPPPPSPHSTGKPRQPADIQAGNTVVFNFSNRKEVPDYIENDGLVIRRKRELPKPGESGFVLLGDLTVETSTDPEVEGSWTLGDPPSPCDVRFQNDNVIINGKSNIRDKSRDQKQLSIQFHEMLTSTFEYPSENSFSEEINTNDCDEFIKNESDVMNNSSFLGNTLIGSVPLGNYTPIKATTFTTNFELGITRAQTQSPAASIIQPSTNYNNITNIIKCHQQQSDLKSNTNEMENETAITGSGTTTKITATTQKTTITTTTEHHHQFISVSSNGHHTINNQSLSGEPDSLQYLKPANDDQTVVWSEGASDLLF